MIVPKEISLGFNSSDAIVITGAGRGIGRSTAINAAAMGLGVAAWDIDADYVTDTVKEIEDSGGRRSPWRPTPPIRSKSKLDLRHLPPWDLFATSSTTRVPPVRATTPSTKRS